MIDYDIALELPKASDELELDAERTDEFEIPSTDLSSNLKKSWSS